MRRIDPVHHPKAMATAQSAIRRFGALGPVECWYCGRFAMWEHWGYDAPGSQRSIYTCMDHGLLPKSMMTVVFTARFSQPGIFGTSTESYIHHHPEIWGEDALQTGAWKSGRSGA